MLSISQQRRDKNLLGPRPPSKHPFQRRQPHAHVRLKPRYGAGRPRRPFGGERRFWGCVRRSYRGLKVPNRKVEVTLGPQPLGREGRPPLVHALHCSVTWLFASQTVLSGSAFDWA